MTCFVCNWSFFSMRSARLVLFSFRWELGPIIFPSCPSVGTRELFRGWSFLAAFAVIDASEGGLIPCTSLVVRACCYVVKSSFTLSLFTCLVGCRRSALSKFFALFLTLYSADSFLPFPPAKTQRSSEAIYVINMYHSWYAMAPFEELLLRDQGPSQGLLKRGSDNSVVVGNEASTIEV